MRHVRCKRSIGVAAISVALGATAFAAVGAQADQGTNAADRAGTATISMELKGKDLFFAGPTSIKSGDELQILNNTDPKKIGPHTFSLVKKKLLPDLDKQAIKDCYKEGVCLQIAKAHKFDFQNDTIGRRLVRAGKEGWDKSFGKRGDSWVAEQEGDTFSQKVSAPPGTTLFYLCDIHPFMQGKIKVK